MSWSCEHDSAAESRLALNGVAYRIATLNAAAVIYIEPRCGIKRPDSGSGLTSQDGKAWITSPASRIAE